MSARPRAVMPRALAAILLALAAPIHSDPAWTAEDSLTAVRFLETLVRRPGSIDSLTAGSPTRDHALGFGRRLREAWVNPAGKLGFAFKIFYEGTHPSGFEVKPVVNYGGLRARILPLVARAFGNPPSEPYHWNLAAAALPLPADSVKLAGDSLPSPAIREALAYYMTPYSGTLYGIRGGEAGQLLENRDHFLGLAEILMADKRIARYLLRSVNPASRLTAAEFILRHKESFPDFETLQATAFRAVFSRPPRAATMRGGLETTEDPRKLVQECALQEARRDGRGVLRMY